MPTTASTLFSAFVILALAATLALRLWLAARQARHVAAHRDRVPEAFAAHVPLAAHQRASDYALAKLRLERLAVLLDALLFVLLSWGGLLQALDDFWTARLAGRAHDLALVASVVLIGALAHLPLAFYRQFGIEARFGFNRMTPALFFADSLKELLVTTLLGLPLLAVVLFLIERAGPAWWCYAWLVWIAFNLLVLFIFPLWIAPLFNRFTPLADGEVKTRVEALLERSGFGRRDLFVMDGSRRTSHGNAYFTGFGKARRIVFFDTLLARLAPEEIEAVLAHELGHFRRRHILTRSIVLFLLAFAFFALLGQLLEAGWFFQGLGVRQPGTAMGLVLFALLLPWLAFPLTPLANALSRRHEFEADDEAIRQTSAAWLARALLRLYADNAATLSSDPWYSLFHDSHPPAAVRIARLQTLQENRPCALPS
jgi:STE24 endopeptidase